MTQPRQTAFSRKTMFWLLRHLIAIAVLPFTVAVLIPVWLARRNGVTPGVGSSLVQIGLQSAGLFCLPSVCYYLPPVSEASLRRDEALWRPGTRRGSSSLEGPTDTFATR
jgi:hypothetical protein